MQLIKQTGVWACNPFARILHVRLQLISCRESQVSQTLVSSLRSVVFLKRLGLQSILHNESSEQEIFEDEIGRLLPHIEDPRLISLVVREQSRNDRCTSCNTIKESDAWGLPRCKEPFFCSFDKAAKNHVLCSNASYFVANVNDSHCCTWHLIWQVEKSKLSKSP